MLHVSKRRFPASFRSRSTTGAPSRSRRAPTASSTVKIARSLCSTTRPAIRRAPSRSISDLSPQLTLEAAILRGGGFSEIPAGSSVSELVYVKLSGNNPAGDERVLELKANRGDEPQFPDDAADEALRELTALVRRYEDVNEAYRSGRADHVGQSLWHLRRSARVKEWSASGAGGGDE